MSIYQLTKKLKSKLKSSLKNKFVVDIFLIGSSIKEKLTPRDIDLIVLLREKDYKKIEDTLHKIKESLDIKEVHIEYLIVDDLLRKSISSTVIHEGISLRYERGVAELLGYKSYSLFTFSLINLKIVEKVRFAQTLYGRKNDGLIQKENGRSLGKGAFIVPVAKQELFREVLKRFKVDFALSRVLIRD